MLIANIEQDGKIRTEKIFVIDAHSHLGQDVDGAIMMNPLAPGTGTFDFWSNFQGKIKAEWEKSGEQSFTTMIEGNSTKISWSFSPYIFTDKLNGFLERLGQKFSDLKEKSKFYTLVDQTVCFPFQDVFRDKYPEALYRASNINISRFTTRFPFSMKLIGYGRCNPMEGEKAVKEVKYAREVLGLRGLKLHPRSEQWVDNVNTDKAINVLIEAAKHSMPVIFDTRGKKTIMDIGELIKSTRTVLQSSYPKLLPHFKVIIAHFAQGNIGDFEVYNTIVQSNTFGDLSMLHGEGAGNFLEDFRKWFKANNKITVDNRDWSEYLLFATDYPYFGDVHASKLMIYIINKRFFDTGGTIWDTRNILGLNQIRLLPEYNPPQIKESTRALPSTLISNLNFRQNNTKANDMTILALAKLINENKIDIKRFCVQFNEQWHVFNEDDILITITSKSNDQDIDLLFVNLVKDQISLVAPLQSNFEWKKFGYKYFNPEDRAFFAKQFKQCYLVTDIDKIKESLAQILS